MSQPHHHIETEHLPTSYIVRIQSFWQTRRQASLLIGVILLLLFAQGLLLSFEQFFANRIYPNVTIRGIPVGQLTEEEARHHLNSHYDTFLRQPLTLTHDTQKWEPSLADIGGRLEIDAAIHQARLIGRQHPDRWSNLATIWHTWRYGHELPLHLTLDQTSLQRYVLARTTDIEQPPTDAKLIIDGTRVVTSSAHVGHQVLVNETLAEVTDALQHLAPQTIAIQTRELPALLADHEVAHAQQQIEQLLQQPVVLTVDEQQWEWSPAELAQMIHIHRVSAPNQHGDRLDIRIDEHLMRERLRPIADMTQHGGSPPRVEWHDGNITIIETGQPVMRVDEAQAQELIISAMTSVTRTVQLPFHEQPYPLNQDNIHELGLRDLLSVGRSDFSGSEDYRITNIQAGMNRLHGVLIAPGEEFSFNNTIGTIGPENGFVMGYAITGLQTQLEWGGGICQDSTTMFRAAFWAGLPITERHEHAFYISWYDTYGFGDYGHGAGLDAAIFTGIADFKFINDTGHWIAIQTHVDVSQALAEIRLYGTDTGRTVELEGPVVLRYSPAPPNPVYVASWDVPPGARHQTDFARGGMDIAFTRIIKEQGEEVKREEFLTSFQPWPNVFEVNPSSLAAYQGVRTQW